MHTTSARTSAPSRSSNSPPTASRAELVPLGDTPDASNPTTPASITYDCTVLLEASVAGEPVDRMAFRQPQAPPPRV